MRITIHVDEAEANKHLPESEPDGSGVGVNYADQVLKAFKLTLEDGRKMLAKRKGLKITITVGEKSGDAIMRRIENGPDVKQIFRNALTEAASNLGAALTFEPNTIYLDFTE
jgi:hypothetical protein